YDSTLAVVLPVHFMVRQDQPWTLILSANWWQNMCLRSFLHSEMIFTSVSWQCELQFSGIPVSA
ncbi:MAG: hypothetical protein ACK5YO_38440, partial [Planctomyces sp.]